MTQANKRILHPILTRRIDLTVPLFKSGTYTLVNRQFKILCGRRKALTASSDLNVSKSLHCVGYGPFHAMNSAEVSSNYVDMLNVIELDTKSTIMMPNNFSPQRINANFAAQLWPGLAC